ncbi:YifB family Mg chelatase-like AAA ATPase [Candidatus Nomurabacteria bacterium]|jgi:magnesium chelatase family protein|nr:MAG: YifB family Mg chelatase-like AAA ATPase [Candidatus Nomurabacteria bacterium]
MSFARLYSAQTSLLRGELITIEVDLSKGLHTFSIVGLPDKAVEEARDRVSSAIKNSGYTSPKSKNEKIIVSLSPAETKKEGSTFDIGIALGYLLASEEITFEIQKKLFLGELALNGEVLPIKGTLPLAEKAKRDGFEELYVPEANAREAALVDGIKVFGVHTLSELITHLTATEETAKIQPKEKTPIDVSRHVSDIDFSDIRGQEGAKRGLEIAAAGGHNIAMYGPPGTGKTMLARAFATLLPSLTLTEALEITSIHSVAGNLNADVITLPPFRAPHHTSSYVSIIGGGSTPKPGEITLAHRGVLFMDEFPEFDKRVIESLRQPLEDKIVSISRAKGTALFPSHFILIAAMNPCPCGYRGTRAKECTCTAGDIARYNRKLSGPIMDRVDIWVEVGAIGYEKLGSDAPVGEKTETIRDRVQVARAKQRTRFENANRPHTTNSDMNAKDISALITLDPKTQTFFNQSATKLNLSPRAYHRVLKLARTIADVNGDETVGTPHILEALQYRPKAL